MVAIRCSAPPGVDEKALLPFRFMQLNAAKHPDWAALAPQASAHCADLRARHPDDAFVFHLSACIALLVSNPTAAMAFCSEALLIDPDYADSRAMLDDMLTSLAAPEDVPLYRNRRRRGLADLADAFFAQGHVRLTEGDAAAADRAFQKGIALNNPTTSQLLDFQACLAAAEAKRAAGTLDAALAERVATFHRLWAAADAASVATGDSDLAAAPDRRQLAEVVTDVLIEAGPGPLACFELGCYTGFNLDLIRRELAGREGAPAVAFHGLEPNAAAVAHGRSRYPDLTLCQGNHADLGRPGLPFPARFDVCLISRVFQMMAEAEVSATLAALGPRTGRLVICDDILNLEGSFPVPREPRLILVHPFRRLLEATGFTIERVIPARIPDRAFSGFIVARSKE